MQLQNSLFAFFSSLSLNHAAYSALERSFIIHHRKTFAWYTKENMKNLRFIFILSQIEITKFMNTQHHNISLSVPVI